MLTFIIVKIGIILIKENIAIAVIFAHYTFKLKIMKRENKS